MYKWGDLMNFSEKNRISARNSRYLECLKSELRSGEEYITTERIAEWIGVGEIFIKRDLNRLHAVDEHDGVYHITTLIRLILN